MDVCVLFLLLSFCLFSGFVVVVVVLFVCFLFLFNPCLLFCL